MHYNPFFEMTGNVFKILPNVKPYTKSLHYVHRWTWINYSLNMKYYLSACFNNPKMYIFLAGVKIVDICLSRISKKQSMAQEKNPGTILLKLIKCSSFVKILMIEGSSNKELFLWTTSLVWSFYELFPEKKK